jgi:uncharacterized cupin superfamily protein
VREDAGLIVTRRVGRQTHYFLNRAPMRQVRDLWIGTYTRDEVRVDCTDHDVREAAHRRPSGKNMLTIVKNWH